MINQILLNTTNIEGLSDILAVLITKAINFGFRILIAILVYIIGAWIISLIRKFVNKILYRKEMDLAVQGFINSSVNIFLKVLLILAIIGVLGIETASFAAIMAAIAFAVGMAMKNNLANFASGVIILIVRPFKINDRIAAQGMDGVVKSISFIYTVLQTGDGKRIYIPNGSLMSSSVINYTEPENLRIDLNFNIAYGNNAKEMKELMMDIVKANDKVLKTPVPSVTIGGVQDGYFSVSVKAWVINSNLSRTKAELNEAIYEMLADRSIYTPALTKVQMVE